MIYFDRYIHKVWSTQWVVVVVVAKEATATNNNATKDERTKYPTKFVSSILEDKTIM